jgi:hypothetical protein
MNGVPCPTCGAPIAGPDASCQRCATSAGPYYEPSGRAPAAGLLLAIAGGGGAAALLAVVYAYFDYLNPFVYFNFIGAMILGGLPAVVAGILLEKGKIRNNAAATWVGLAVGLVALYVAWAAWLNAFFDGVPGREAGLLELLANPAAIGSGIAFVSANGAWTVGSSTPTGTVLWVVWGAEAALILGVSVYAIRGFITDRPFCEACAIWCTEAPGVLETRGWDKDALKARLEAKDFGYLGQLGRPSRHDVEGFAYDITRCPKCGGTASLKARKVVIAEGGARQSQVVLEGLLLSRDEADRLRNFEFDAPPPAAAAKGA